jgi:hypothetical protein
MRAVVLGGAPSVWDDLRRTLGMASVDVVVATNHAGRDFEGSVDHWVSFHAELMPKWVGERRAAGLPDAGTLWTVERPLKLDGLEFRKAANWGGSSGLLAVTVALELGCTKIVLCGVPLDHRVGHYDNPKPWGEGGSYRRGWLGHKDEMSGKVRSWSGWTGELLGVPTKEWLEAA